MKWSEVILAATQYGGNTEPGQKSISASSITKPVLIRWLQWKYGVIPQKTVSMATIGSLVHKAIEHIVINMGTNIEPEKECKLDLGDDWFLTGTADIVNHIDKEIIDLKIVKTYRVKKLQEAIKSGNLESDDYIVQLNAYRQMIDPDYKMRVMALSPDAGYDFKKKTVVPTFQMIDVPEMDAIGIARKAVAELRQYIDTDTTPSMCDDVWPRKGVGPVRCMIYCNYNEVCPYYKPSLSQQMKSIGW